MASVTRENIGTLQDKITVKLVKDDFMPSFEKKLKEYAKKAAIPGFRKGMVPSALIRKMYGPSIFNEEVIHTASHQLEDFLKKEQLAIFAQPMVMATERAPIDFANPGDIDFDFEIGIKPQLDVLSVVHATPLTRYKITVTDKMLDDEVARLQDRFGTEDEQNEVTSGENIIYADYTACDEHGAAAADAKPAADKKRLDLLPAGLQTLLMGKESGATLVIAPNEVCTPEELPGFVKNSLHATAGDVSSYYSLQITKVANLIPEKVGPELFAKVYKDDAITDEAGFRNKLKGELEREFDRITGERMQNEMYEFLVHNINMQLPVPFLKRWMMEGGEQRKSAEDVEREFGSFEHQLRWQLISDKILTDAGISVTREEVEHNIKGSVLRYFGMGIEDEDDAPWLDAYMEKMAKDDKMMDETYRRLLFGKLFAFLATQFQVAEQEIDEADFFKLADPHATHHHHDHDHHHDDHHHHDH